MRRSTNNLKNMTNNTTTMTEIDYTILEGLATPVEIDDEWIRFRSRYSYVSFRKQDISSVESTEHTIRIEVNYSAITIWKEVNHLHITIL